MTAALIDPHYINSLYPVRYYRTGTRGSPIRTQKSLTRGGNHVHYEGRQRI